MQQLARGTPSPLLGCTRHQAFEPAPSADSCPRYSTAFLPLTTPTGPGRRRYRRYRRPAAHRTGYSAHSVTAAAPLHAPDGRQVINFHLGYLNPAGQQQLDLPEREARSMLKRFPTRSRRTASVSTTACSRRARRAATRPITKPIASKATPLRGAAQRPAGVTFTAHVNCARAC